MAGQPARDVLDAEDRPAAPARTGWLVGGLALVVLATALVAGRPSAPGADVGMTLVGHRGSVLAGQSYLRLWFSLAPTGGDVDLEQVTVVLGSVRQPGTLPALRGRDGELRVLVDVVPSCPDALRLLPAGTLEVAYRAAGHEQHASLPLPVEGSLPRLVQRRCDGLI